MAHELTMIGRQPHNPPTRCAECTGKRERCDECKSS